MAIDDVCRRIITCTEQLIVAAVGGSAGAGGVMLALGADRVLQRDGTVLNPHYQNMGLYGSEYWTYLLPGRVGRNAALSLTSECLPIGAREAGRIGLADQTLTRTVDTSRQQPCCTPPGWPPHPTTPTSSPGSSNDETPTSSAAPWPVPPRELAEMRLGHPRRPPWLRRRTTRLYSKAGPTALCSLNGHPQMRPRYPHPAAAKNVHLGRSAVGQRCAQAGSRDSNPAVGRMIESGLVDQAGRATSWWACGPGRQRPRWALLAARFAVRGDQCGVNA